MKIRFGTSGWRGVIAREFTWDRVQILVDAISVWLQRRDQRSIVIGGDTRFLSPELARSTASRMAGYGFRVYLADRPVPTPVLSHALRSLGAGGIINFTASHNPPVYNGIKFSPDHGGPASDDVTSAIENLIESGSKPGTGTGSVEEHDFIVPYLEEIDKFLDASVFRDSDLRLVYDAFSGTGSGVLDRKLIQLGASVRVINGVRDPLFAGKQHPEPNESGLEELAASVVRSGASLGLGTDGDADRFGLVDERGKYVSPHDFFPLLLDYLVSSRGWGGTVARSITTSSMLDRVASALGIPVEVTPVGFKYLGAFMMERDVVLACEESGGMSILGHVPEKDGVLACLLAAEMICARGKSISEQIEALWCRYGRLFNERIDIPLSPPTCESVQRVFFSSAPEEIAGRPVTGIDRKDGSKILLEDDTYVLIRLSGTEPLARIYVQADSPELIPELVEGVKSLIREGTLA